MDKFLIFFGCAALLTFIIGVFAFVFIHLRKSMITTGVQLQCGTGDSEVMVLNLNFYDGEDEESKKAKVADGYARIEARRQENHEKWLAIKQKAIEENEQAQSQGKELKLRSKTQEG